MNIFDIIRQFPKAREYIDFNERDRGHWVEQVARSLPNGTRILDVGAGPCRYKHLFTHCHYEAHDFAQYEGTPTGVQAETWSYGKLDYISDIVAIPVPDASFDAILCTEVLEHVPYPIQALKEMSRILKPGGQLFVSAPLGSGVHQAPYHFYGGYTPFFYNLILPEHDLVVDEILPNGGFFKHYLQESARVGHLLTKKYYVRKYSPRRLMIKFIFNRLFPIVFYHLDKEYSVEEHTVGYFVTAHKPKKVSSE